MAKNLNLGIFFMISRSNISKITNFSEKQVSFKLKVIFSTNFRPKTKKIVRAVFEKNIKVSDFGLIWRPFREYLQIKNFFQKSGSVTFLPLQSPNFMQKIRKILRAVSEKTALPTNQPTNQLLPTTPILQDLADAVQKHFKIRKEHVLIKYDLNKFLPYLLCRKDMVKPDYIRGVHGVKKKKKTSAGRCFKK